MTFQYQPLANGISTDHPVPDLPFVDDTHIPLDEGPEAIEAVGRGAGNGMWGRYDNLPDGAWHAFTTDPIRHDYGWSVRYHPLHGRTVLLMSDNDIASMHSHWGGSELLFRAGGYWWDGTAWYRPGQIWHPVHQRNEHRRVTAPVTVTAADLLDASADPTRAYVAKVANFQPGAGTARTWIDHLALWARTQNTRPGALPLERAVVNLASPELAADQLIGTPEVAALAGISASTLRSYITRGENSVPMPQATVGGRNLWSKPVATDWAEARRRSAEGVETMLAAGDEKDLSPGAAEVRARFASRFFHALWRPAMRKRWVLRSRNETDVQDVANELAWSVAANLNELIPAEPLSATVRHAVLDVWSDSLELQRRDPSFELNSFHLSLSVPIAKMLDWYIRHDPSWAMITLREIQYEASSRLGISAGLSGRALRRSLSMDGKLDEALREEYLDRVLAADEPA
ncbi:hypothetical protein OG871_40025 (plasmid) [Kitasatospora sp. NBC_00374]|uniref:helix-turn-helix transcriptional regulator n=1 Tax=Kitasatospora sp. NBC_00374 TaxID=2975964 RepID=UPI002F91321E